MGFRLLFKIDPARRGLKFGLQGKFSKIILILIPIFLFFVSGCSRKTDNVVVVYVSEDQVFSEPILKDFEKETGIKVKAVYDTEESKSTGPMNRLLAEKDNPQADVYWANEPIRAEILRQRAVSTPYRSPSSEGIAEQFRDPQGHWTGFSARVRMLIVAKELDVKPTSIED